MYSNDQIKSLILKHKLKDNVSENINKWVNLLQSRLNDLEEFGPQNLDEIDILGDVVFPLNDQDYKTSASFLFKLPKIYSIGSYGLNCNARRDDNKFAIDVALEIPSMCWQKKDHQNYVYYRKRSFYLAYIAKQLMSFEDIVSKVEFKLLNGDNLMPVIIATPSRKMGLLCKFKLFAFPSICKSFICKKFHPTNCNIQPNLFNKSVNLESTPMYNSFIQQDLSLLTIHKNLKEILHSFPNVRDALVLLRIWLEKRDLRNKFAHILTVFTCHLLKEKVLNPSLSPFQLFNAILNQISMSSWESNGLVIDFDDSMENTNSDLCLDYFNHFQVVFLEFNSNFNLCYNVTIDLYERLKYDAQVTINEIHNAKLGLIENIFLNKIDFNLYFDYLINISIDSINPKVLQTESIILDYGFDLTKATINQLILLIKRALGDRVTMVQHKQLNDKDSWDITAVPPKHQVNYVTIGILIDGPKSVETITKGPLANGDNAPDFRNFWGEKSEIRRFQSGDICEAVYWDCDYHQEKRNIIINIVKFILNRKMHLKMNMISSTVGVMDSFLQIKNIKFDNHKLCYGTGEHFISLINQNMNLLKKYLHNLSGLSFSVVEVIGVDSVFRSTEVFPSFPVDSKPKDVKFCCNTFEIDFDEKIKHVKPYRIMLKIDADNKLISDLETIKAQKYLYNYELGKVLAKSHNLFVRPTTSYVDVFFNGYVFRITICLNKEIVIYRQIKNKTKMVKSIENVQADKIEFDTLVLPAISACLNSICKENSSYALTCRLFKRWLGIQMIKHFFHEITLDLLVAYIYYNNHHSYCPPNSHVIGFIRVLQFIAEFDFSKNLLIFNFNNSLSVDKINEIKESFVLERPKLPVIFIVTPYDKKLSYHTRTTPNALIVFHMQKLAGKLFSDITSSLNSFKMPDIKSVVNLNSSMFDMIIKLNSKAIVNKYESLDFPSNITIKQSLYSNDHKHSIPITDYNPVSIYLNCLKRTYHNIALFFYDEFGGQEIGVLLRPETLETKPFKFSSIEASVLASTSYSHSTDNVNLNIKAITEDFEILGENLVERVIVRPGKLMNKLVNK